MNNQFIYFNNSCYNYNYIRSMKLAETSKTAIIEIFDFPPPFNENNWREIKSNDPKDYELIKNMIIKSIADKCFPVENT